MEARPVREVAYEVVSPEGRAVVHQAPARAALSSLDGKTVCEVWDWLYRGDLMFRALREGLRTRHPNLRVVGYDSFGNIHGPDAARVLRELPDRLRRHGCDAVIAGVGA